MSSLIPVLTTLPHEPSSVLLDRIEKDISSRFAIRGRMTEGDHAELELREVTDLEAVRRIALGAGLEDGPFEDIVYACGHFADDDLKGCAALKNRGGVFSVEWLAVDSELRGKGLGRLLVCKIEAEARSRGAGKIWALARAPAFFERIGYRIIPPEESPGPTIENCLKCRQYNDTCFPKIVTRELD
jgi:N-acetylglutamate synthase-like GNAT family acetyltransferase